MKKPLIILAGPTATGKTALSIDLAKAVNGEIISADSMQVYRGMDIGSAKISQKEMEALLEQLMGLENPYTCPHGRPVIIKMTRYELEKKFKRVIS